MRVDGRKNTFETFLSHWILRPSTIQSSHVPHWIGKENVQCQRHSGNSGAVVVEQFLHAASRNNLPGL